MYCLRCGNKLERNEDVCSVCGFRILWEEEESEMEMLEEQYQELLDQKGQKSKLDQEIAELRQEIKEILNSVEKQSFRYGNQKVNFCPWCGAPAEDAKFCTQCGAQLPS